MKFLAVLSLGAFLLVLPLAAQEASSTYGVVLFASGEDLSIQRGQSFRTFDLAKDTVIGLSVLQGDLLQTGPKTTVEIELLPSKTYIKVAENTSFRVVSIQKQTGGLEMLYGRVHAKVTAVTTGDPFYIKGKAATAGVRGTDFGYDLVLTPGATQTTKTSVYCFEGSVAVGAGEAPKENAVLISANQMVSVLSTNSKEASDKLSQGLPDSKVRQVGNYSMFVDDSVTDTIRTYWNDNPFQGTKQDDTQLKNNFPDLQDQVKSEQEKLLGKTTGTPLQDINVSVAHRTPTLSDQIPPIPTIDAISALHREQYVYAREKRKSIGILLSVTGLTIGILGQLSGGVSSQLLMLSDDTAYGLSTSTAIGGGALIGVGSVLYLTGLLDK